MITPSDGVKRKTWGDLAQSGGSAADGGKRHEARKKEVAAAPLGGELGTFRTSLPISSPPNLWRSSGTRRRR
jgi:hypothetical protein